MRSSEEIPDSSILERRWFSKMSTYWLASILPSTSTSCPIPFQPIHPHTIRFPPPNLTVPCISLLISPSPFCFHTHCFPSDPSLLILVSSNPIILFQSSTVHSLCFRAKANCFFLWVVLRNGFFFLVTALNEFFLRMFLTVCEDIGLGRMLLIVLVTSTVVVAFPVAICLRIKCWLALETLDG